MLDDKTRVTLFWFTVGMIGVVAIVAIVTLLRACGGPIAEESNMTVNPPEITLCLGQTHQFTISGDVETDAEITWKASGGAIDEHGLFTTGDEPGDYVVTAIHNRPRRISDSVVHIVPCTPTPTPTPTPYFTPTPIPTPTPIASPTPTPLPADRQGDIGLYDTGAPIEGAPASIDIHTASVDIDLQINLTPTADVPQELTGWAAEGEALLWITLYAPIPDPPAYTDWLFALDLDGNTTTGRPVNSARINPDLGDDAIVGVLYNPAIGEYAPYFLVWDPNQGEWVDGPGVPRFRLGESRTVIGLALPLEMLTQTAAQTTGTTLVPEAVKGRAAALSFVGEQTVVDFYPDRPGITP